MVRRYFNDTSSDHVRNWAEGFMQLSTCPECNGARLQKGKPAFSRWMRRISPNWADMDLDKLRGLVCGY